MFAIHSRELEEKGNCEYQKISSSAQQDYLTTWYTTGREMADLIRELENIHINFYNTTYRYNTHPV